MTVGETLPTFAVAGLATGTVMAANGQRQAAILFTATVAVLFLALTVILYDDPDIWQERCLSLGRGTRIRPIRAPRMRRTRRAPPMTTTGWREHLGWWIGLDRALDGALSRALAPTAAKIGPTDCRIGGPMPTPPHLTSLLTALGDGGTTATAEAVCAAAGGIPGHVPAPTIEAVMTALGDTAARDTADRVVTVYTDALPAPVVEPADAPETPQDDAGDDNAADAPEADAAPVDEDSDPQDADPHAMKDAPVEVMDDDDIDWDDVLPDPAPADAPKPEPSAADIRAWAKTTGVKVPARGGIPQDVRAAYDAAH